MHLTEGLQVKNTAHTQSHITVDTRVSVLLCIAATQSNVRYSNRILGQVVGYTRGEIPPEERVVLYIK